MCGYITAEGDKYECDSCHEKNTSSVKDIVPSTVSTEEMSSKHKSKKLSVTSSPTIITAIDTASIVSTITETAGYTHIEKDYFISYDQNINTEIKKRDGDIWIELRKAVQKEIDSDIKSMMILRSQEVGLKVKKEGGQDNVTCWNDIGLAWRNDDSIDTAKKLYKVVHSTFDDKSGYEIYMETNIMNKLKLKYKDEEYKKKGCIARMIITRKSELNKLINKRSETTHQKKISRKRVTKCDQNTKGSFTLKLPDNTT